MHDVLGEIIELEKMNSFLRRLSVPLISAMLLACGEDRASEDHLTSADHLAKAETFLEQPDQSSAIIELKKALKKDVNNSRASALLGKLYFEEGAYEDAARALSRNLSSGVDTNVVVPMLAQVLLSLGEFERLDKLTLDGLDPESRSIVQAAKGLSMIYRENLVLAEELMDAALRNEPHSPYAQVAIARLSLENKAYDEARSRLKEVISKSPEYALAWNLLGDIESAQLRPNEANIAYSRVIRFAGASFDALLNRAMMRIYLGDFQGARKDLDRVKRTFGPSRYHPGVQFAWGLIYLQNKQLEAAGKSFFEASQYSDTYPQTQYYMATIHLEKGFVGPALNSAYNFLGLVPNSLVGAKLAAKLELGLEGYSKAEKLLRPVVAARPDDIEALNLLASALLAQGESVEAIELLARIAELQPDSTEAGVKLGAGFLAAGSEELGVETLRDVLAKDPGYEQADILIVLNYLRQNNISEAILAAQGYRDRNPDSATLYNLLGHAYLASKEQEKARAAFNNALELSPGDPGAASGLADFALSDKDYESAREYYKKVLEHNPDHMKTRMKIVESYAVEGKEQELSNSLQDILLAYPRAMESRLVKARYYMGKGQLDMVLPLFGELTDEQKEAPEALVTLAGFELAVGRYNQALVTLGRLIKVRPDVAQYHYLKSKAYAGLGDLETLFAELERTLELDPNHFYAKIAMARWALLSNQIDIFEKELAELRAMAPENLDVVKLEVAGKQNRGDKKSAMRLLETLFEQEPTTSNVIALAAHHQSVGNIDGAIALLQLWIEDHADDIKAREKLAEIYDSSNQVGGVVYQYREILKVDPEHVIALNNLAWHMLDDDPGRALDYARAAITRSPDSSAILDTLAMAQMKNSSIVEARRSIDRALSLSPTSPAIRFHEAQIRVAEGDTIGAIDALTSLLKKNAVFSERAEAEMFLSQLK